ncbi:MAG: phospholipase D-like domain-containing protein [Chloroflexota bacterium]
MAAAINATNNTLDVAAFELNNEVITEAIINAHERGVQVRVVTDDEHGLEDDDTTVIDLELAGIPIVDDDRSGLMHNKFIIMDGISVWMGSMNFTVNGVYRNNNNGIILRSRRAVQVYQAEFDEMFARGEFGVTSDPSNTGNFNQDGVPIEIYFGAENNVVAVLERELGAATESIRFMAFAFTLDEIGDVILTEGNDGVEIGGIFEVRGSETEFSEMTRLHCAGLDVRQDGNNGTMHHKVFIVDETTVITGSFNFSSNASRSNDENIMIIRDADIAALYTDEFFRVQSIASRPDVTC